MAVVQNREQFHGTDDGEGEDFYSKPSRPVGAALRCFHLLSRFGWMASFLDGAGKRPAARRSFGGLFPAFIEHLASSSLSPKTIRGHVDNLWMLGGEIIRDLHYGPSLRKRPADRLLRNAVHEDGGPLIHNGSEEAQCSFDATCRKLHRFVAQPQR